MAAVNPDDHYVLTLVVVSPAGVFARYSQNWFEIDSANSLGNCYLVGVEPTAIETYDAYDSRGAQVAIESLPTIRGWTPQAQVATVQVAEEVVEPVGSAPGNPVGPATLTAAGVLEMPTSLEQLDVIGRSLAYATENPEVRWAVQRRLEQLGWTEELPWN
jgi:hypothetical protein